MSDKPFVQLTGQDGNVFSLCARVTLALRGAGQPDKAQEFWDRLTSCDSYEAALTLMHEYVEVG